jgi:hypothetical protein
MHASRFLLSKWYLDLLDSSGRGMIGYHADVTWGKLSFRYDGLIPIGEPGFKARGTFSSRFGVKQDGDILTWQTGVSTGTWQQLSSSFEVDLLASNEGHVRWNCLHPSSQAKATVGDIDLEGMGYAEKLEMTLPPWRLPIKELLWGRYVSKQHSLVWIRWIGPEPRVILYLDGRAVQQAEITSTRISFATHRIDLPTLPLRHGTLGETLFAGAKVIAHVFPKSILALRESKWYGKAALTQNNTVIDEGNVIHETVCWP